MEKETKRPPVVKLVYAKDDLIIKEGNYGVSIFEVISGKVGIFIDSDGAAVQVATLGPGDIIGEMIFLTGTHTPRSASARALTECVLEAWHPDLLASDYSNMPPILRQLADQAMRRLMRLNKMVTTYSAKIKAHEPAQAPLEKDNWASKRAHYRKVVNLTCEYRPVGASKELRLAGKILDLSQGGLKMMIRSVNAIKFSHVPGDEFIVDTSLGELQPVTMTAKVANIDKGEAPQTILLGMTFTYMNYEDRRRLGFFLLPSSS